MIIKSFFRKKSTILYFIIFSILFVALFLINDFIQYLVKLNDLKFKEDSYLYINSKMDLMNDITKDEWIENSYCILQFKYSYFEHIAENQLVNYDLGSVIVYSSKDKNLSLKEHDVVIGLSELDYVNKKNTLSTIEGEEIFFESDDQKIPLKIKSVVNMGQLPGIVISEKLFDSLNNNSHHYISNIKYEKNIENLVKKYSSNADEILVLNDSNISNYNKKEKIKKLLDIVRIVNALFLILFIIIFLIVNRNIVSDLNLNLKFEKKMGFNKRQICLNIIRRLGFIHIISIINSVLIIQIVKFLLKTKYDLDLNSSLNLHSLIILSLIIFGDLLLSIIVNNKSWKGYEV